jgi:hypothetical protein
VNALRTGRLLAGLLALGLVGCGGDDPFCGDGKVDSADGEQCDDGNSDETDACRACMPPPRATLKWEFNLDAAPGFDADTCMDFGVATVDIEVTSGATTRSRSDGCTQRQIVFDDLMAGTWSARVTPRTAAGDSLVKAPVESTFTLGSEDIDETLVVPPDAWTGSHSGTFLFRVEWAGATTCVAASPAVTQQVLTLSRDGVPVAISTQNGAPLDGSAPATCEDSDNSGPAQAALAVPFGPATLHIVGLDADDVPRVEQSFETFVGAGVTNPILHFDVGSLAPDAGVPDAGAPDAGAPDAGVPDAAAPDAALPDAG